MFCIVLENFKSRGPILFIVADRENQGIATLKQQREEEEYMRAASGQSSCAETDDSSNQIRTSDEYSRGKSQSDRDDGDDVESTVRRSVSEKGGIKDAAATGRVFGRGRPGCQSKSSNMNNFTSQRRGSGRYTDIHQNENIHKYKNREHCQSNKEMKTTQVSSNMGIGRGLSRWPHCSQAVRYVVENTEHSQSNNQRTTAKVSPKKGIGRGLSPFQTSPTVGDAEGQVRYAKKIAENDITNYPVKSKIYYETQREKPPIGRGSNLNVNTESPVPGNMPRAGREASNQSTAIISSDRTKESKVPNIFSPHQTGSLSSGNGKANAKNRKSSAIRTCPGLLGRGCPQRCNKDNKPESIVGSKSRLDFSTPNSEESASIMPDIIPVINYPKDGSDPDESSGR